MSTTSDTRPATFADLLCLALDAHRRGEPWASFWPSVVGTVDLMADGDPERRQRLKDRLLSLLVSGSMDGLEPPGSEPWEADAAGDGWSSIEVETQGAVAGG